MMPVCEAKACADVRAQAIISTAAPIMRRAGVTTDDGKSGRRSEGRTNDLAWLRHDENEVISAVVERVANLIGLPSENAEKLQVIHYQEGQRYNRHADAYQPLSDRGKRAMGHAGNRMVTALFYLSDVKAGGGTGFSNLKMEVQAETGKLLVFHNCYEGTCQVHPDSVHAGLPVVEGDKWAVRAHPRIHNLVAVSKLNHSVDWHSDVCGAFVRADLVCGCRRRTCGSTNAACSRGNCYAGANERYR
jgi:prolyl 4-hydroxylase